MGTSKQRGGVGMKPTRDGMIEMIIETELDGMDME